MTRRGWTKADLSRAVGVEASRLSRWQGGQMPTVEAVRGVADTLGLDLLQTLVEIGTLRPEEVARIKPVTPDPATLTADELAAEVTRRLLAGEAPAPPTSEEVAATPGRYAEGLKRDLPSARRRRRSTGTPDPGAGT